MPGAAACTPEAQVPQIVTEGIPVECRNPATEDPFDDYQPITVPFLTASITIDI